MKNQDNSQENLLQNSSENDLKPKKKNKKVKIILITIACILVLSIVGAAVGGTLYIRSVLDFNYNEITKVPQDLGFEEVKSDEVVNIALFGLDTRDMNSFEGRSDAIIVLSVNKTDRKIKLTSILRDSFIPIEKKEGTVYHILNHAYYAGGPELAIKTINQVYDLDISEYATVNFFGIMSIVDAVGGIEIEITQKEIVYINGWIEGLAEKLNVDYEENKITKSGKQHVNGVQAMAYTSIRNTANADGVSRDYGRTDRQRYVLKQLFNQTVSMDKLQIIDLIKALTPYCETSLSYTEMLGLATNVLLQRPTFEETRIPTQNYLMKQPKNDVGDVLYYDLDYAAKVIHAFIYDDIKPEDYIKQNPIQKNDWYAEIQASKK